MLFSNFTEKARIAISEAHDAAAEMGHNYIGSEHLLMGLIREGSGVAAKVLEKNGVTVEKVKDKINEYIGIGVSLPQQTELPLTPRSKRILEMSALEARRLSFVTVTELPQKFLNRLVLICRISIRIQSVQ